MISPKDVKRSEFGPEICTYRIVAITRRCQRLDEDSISSRCFMTIGDWEIIKAQRGFSVANLREPAIVSWPWIPKWYLKWLYPYAILRAVQVVKQSHLTGR